MQQDTLSDLRTNRLRKIPGGKSLIPDSKELTLRILESGEEMDALTADWSQLTERAGAHICSSPEWVKAWWTCFGISKQRSIYLITLWKNNRLVALAPMYTGYSTLAGIVVERRLQMIGSGGNANEQIGFLDDYGISDFLDIIVEPDEEEDVAETLTNFFLSNSPDVDHINFHQSRDDSFVNRMLRPRLEAGGSTRVQTFKTDICPYISLDGVSTLPDYISGVKSNARRRLRQTLKAREKQGIYSIRSVETQQELPDAVDRIITLHQERWNHLGFPGVFHDNRFSKFFKIMSSLSMENGMLWFREAVDKDGVCASRMLIRYNNRYYDYISGFDDNRESSKFRPGIGLLLKVVDDALDEGVDSIQLLRGEESYKYDFTDLSQTNWSLTLTCPDRRSLFRKAGSAILRLQAKLYKHLVRESRLLSVQAQQNGRVHAVPGYLRFRYNSLQRKLNDS